MERATIISKATSQTGILRATFTIAETGTPVISGGPDVVGTLDTKISGNLPLSVARAPPMPAVIPEKGIKY